jgi:hypothetical protein
MPATDQLPAALKAFNLDPAHVASSRPNKAGDGLVIVTAGGRKLHFPSGVVRPLIAAGKTVGKPYIDDHGVKRDAEGRAKLTESDRDGLPRNREGEVTVAFDTERNTYVSRAQASQAEA